MRRYAANRVFSVTDQIMFRNWVVEVDDKTHFVERTFGLKEEIRQTEWKGGIIIICGQCLARDEGEKFADFLKKITAYQHPLLDSKIYAYHITAFDVNAMEFTKESRIIRL